MRPTTDATPTAASRKITTAQPPTAAAAGRVDQYGNAVPQQGTPEYDAWWRSNLQQQGLAGQQTLGQIDQTAQIADLRNQAPTMPAGGTGQFAQTLKYQPSLGQIAASAPAVGAGGYSAAPTATLVGIKSATGAKAPMGGFDNGGIMTAGPSKAQMAANQARSALGPAPQMDVGFADRQLGAYQEALGMSREVLDRLLNGPSQAKAVGARALENQLALARSARGGPGAVQDALNAAQQQAPQLQAQASQQAIAEQQGLLSTAGNVASNFAQAALGARGQDIQIEQTNVDAATKVLGQIAQLTGQQLQLDQQNEQFLGQMARDWAQLDFDWSKMSVDAQNQWFDRQVQIYGIDQQVAAQMKAIAAQEGIGPADWFNGIVGIIGAGAGVGAAALGKP